MASTFLKDTVKPEGCWTRPANQAFFEGVGSVSIAGPYAAKGPGDTAKPPQDFRVPPTRADEMKTRAPRKIITTLARRAYRRPINKDEIPSLMIPYKAARDARRV